MKLRQRRPRIKFDSEDYVLLADQVLERDGGAKNADLSRICRFII
jgi:hypothetical protein